MNKHILVVDSSRVIRTLFSIYAQQAGHRVTVLSSLLEAHIALQSAPHAPDLLFLAVHSTKKDERQLIREVQTQPSYSHTVLVLMLTEELLRNEQHLAQGERTRVLIKPFRVQEVLALLCPVPSPHQGNPVPHV